MKKNIKKDGLSIIIPCYNVEKYIVNCLDSLQKQLASIDYEIILIDDKSQDSTIDIIEKYISEHDLNIIFLKNSENKGAGYSRNKALKEANFDFVSFIDADDYVDDNYYQVMLDLIKNEKSDLAVCDINIVYDGTDDNVLCACWDGEINKYNIINNGYAASPCNKIIRKELLLKYPFAENIMNEDIPAILAILINAKKVSCTHETKYNYIQRQGSVQNASLSDKKLDLFKAISILEERISKNDYDKYMEAIIFQQIIMFLVYVPIKEKDFFIRGKFLRKFSKLSKKYDLKNNSLYLKFVKNLGKKSTFYYNLLLSFNSLGFGYLTSFLISTLKVYQKYFAKKSVIKPDITLDDLVQAAIENSKLNGKKTVTVAIPNYNYEKFLFQRIYSILYQKYKINEIIILDDCSKDNSRKIINEITNVLTPYIKVKKIFNGKNSGSVFKQWQKAIENSSSDYLWIAEADDYCSDKMLNSLMKLVESDKDISLAYVDTAFIDKEGKIILKTIKPEIDIMKTGHWDKNFINDGDKEINNFAFLNCTIANVSSVIFKVNDYTEIFEELKNYKQVGDYLFYIYVMGTGKVAFYNKPYNYYRLHGNNVTSTTKKQLHFNELKRVHHYIDNKYHLEKWQKDELKKRYEFLEKVWNVKDEDK